MHQISAAEIFITQYTEDEVDDRCSGFDIRVFNETRWIEFGEGEFVNEFFQRHTILQADRNRDRETVHHAAHGSTFFRHIDEDLTERTITILTCTKEYRLSIDLRFLRKAA